MTATYTFDIFCTLDGYGSYDEHGDWGGYWGKQGPEFLEHRLASYDPEQRMVFGANSYREFVEMLGTGDEETGTDDSGSTRMRASRRSWCPRRCEGPLEWANATVVRGDAIDVVARLKAESDVPLRSHGSLSLNRALLAAGLVDRVQVTVFPVISGKTGTKPIFAGAADFDLELVESRILDGRTQELTYRPAPGHDERVGVVRPVVGVDLRGVQVVEVDHAHDVFRIPVAKVTVTRSRGNGRASRPRRRPPPPRPSAVIEHAARQLGDPVGADVTHAHERVRVPPLVVARRCRGRRARPAPRRPSGRGCRGRRAR